MAQQLTSITYRSTKADGTPNALGTVATYLAGTLTNAATYTTAAGDTANTNPVTLGADGCAQIWLDPALSYRFIESDADGVPIPGRDVSGIVGGGVSASDLASTASGKGAALVGYKHGGTATVARTVEDRLQEVVSIEDFGGNGNGAADNTSAFAAARAYCAELSAAGNRVKLVFPAGRYTYTESPNWAMNRLHMEFQGEVWLINTGTGSSFILDGGATGTGVYGMRITGFPLVYGDADTEHGFYLRSIHRSFLQLNCRGAGTTFSGLYMEWCVSDTVEFIMNFNEGGLFNTPARGMTLNLRGSAEETSYCTFINPELSGLPLGAYFDGALGNIFIGGAVQGNVNGVQLTANAWNNKFIGTDWEVNSGYDVSCAARETQFIGCDFETGPIFTSGAVNNTVLGGVTEDITVESGALRTLFSGVVHNRFSAGSITDAGTQTRFRDMRNKGTGTIEDEARTRTALTVGASPFTYTNTSGNDQTVIVSGGTVSQIVLTRFAGDPVGLTSGQFYLEPGDAITVTYSSAPSVIRWT